MLSPTHVTRVGAASDVIIAIGAASSKINIMMATDIVARNIADVLEGEPC